MNWPSNENPSISSYYDEFSKRYDAERREGYFEFINEMEFEKIRPLAVGKKTLEIGCGTGLILERTHVATAEAYGVDISPGMITVCKAKGLKVCLGSVTELPFNDASFDLVYSCKVLGHVPDIGKALAEIIRVTRPDGRMLLEFYNPMSFKALGDRLRSVIHRKKLIYIRHDSPKDIQSMLPDGMCVLSTRGIRIFGPMAYCYTLPGIGRIVRNLERLSCDGPLMKFGGYFMVELGFVEKFSQQVVSP